MNCEFCSPLHQCLLFILSWIAFLLLRLAFNFCFQNSGGSEDGEQLTIFTYGQLWQSFGLTEVKFSRNEGKFYLPWEVQKLDSSWLLLERVGVGRRRVNWSQELTLLSVGDPGAPQAWLVSRSSGFAWFQDSCFPSASLWAIVSMLSPTGEEST